MRAHLFGDGGGIVTGTTDVEAARDLIRRTWAEQNRGLTLEQLLADPDERYGVEQWDKAPQVQRGRVVPASRLDPDCTWYWKAMLPEASGSGVTTAVVWDHEW